MTTMLRARWALALSLLAWTPAGAAEIALLKSADVPAWKPTVEAVKKSAAPLVVTEYDLRNDRAEADRVLAELKGKDVIIVAFGAFAAQAARVALPEVPLVFAMVPDPAKIGLNPAPGLAGVGFAIPVKNQLAAFRMVNPRGVRIGVVHSEEVAKQVEEAEKAAGILRIALVAKPVAAVSDVPQALRSLLEGDSAIDALWVPADPLWATDQTRSFMLQETLKAGKPVYAFSATLVGEGALVSNGPDFKSIGDQAAELAQRIASGEKGRIEMLIPRAELVINKKIADKLKIEIPADALRQAKVN